MNKKELVEDNTTLKKLAESVAVSNKKLRSELAELKIWMNKTRPYCMLDITVWQLFKGETKDGK